MTEKKYRLLKDLPGCEFGAIFEIGGNYAAGGKFYNTKDVKLKNRAKFSYPAEYVENNIEWFKLIEEKSANPAIRILKDTCIELEIYDIDNKNDKECLDELLEVFETKITKSGLRVTKVETADPEVNDLESIIKTEISIIHQSCIQGEDSGDKQVLKNRIYDWVKHNFIRKSEVGGIVKRYYPHQSGLPIINDGIAKELLKLLGGTLIDLNKKCKKCGRMKFDDMYPENVKVPYCEIKWKAGMDSCLTELIYPHGFPCFYINKYFNWFMENIAPRIVRIGIALVIIFWLFMSYVWLL